MPIKWHVNDLKVSHSDKDIVNYFIQWTKKTYEDEKNNNPYRGNIHDYPAMTLDYTRSRQVRIYL